MVEYAWRQPNGEIAPVLQTEGYTLMIKSDRGEWVPEGTAFVSDLVAAGWTPPGTEAECTHEHVSEGTHTNGYVVAADAFELAVKQMSDRAPLHVLRARAHWFYAEMLALAQTGAPDRAESPFQVGALLGSNDPEPPPGTVVLDTNQCLAYRSDDADEAIGDRKHWFSDNDVCSWTRLAGNNGPVRVIALPQA